MSAAQSIENPLICSDILINLLSIDSMCKLGLYEDVSSCAVKSILEAKCGSELISVNVHWKFNTSLPQSTEPIASTIGWTCNNTEDLIAGIAPEPINIAAFLRALQTKSSVILPNILLSDEIDISNTVTVQYIPVNVDSEPKPQDAQLLFARNDSVIVAVAEVLQSSRNTEKAGSVGESKASLDINGGDTSIDTTASLVHRLVEILTYAAKRILFYQRGREKNILYVGEGRLNSSTSLSSKLQAFTAQISGSSNSSSASIAANKFWLDSKFRVMVSENLAQLVGSSVGLMTPIIAHQDIYSDQNIWKGRVAIHMDDCSLRYQRLKLFPPIYFSRPTSEYYAFIQN